MPRKNLVRSKVLPYHVVNRVNNREWFKLPLSTVWGIFSEACWESHFLHGPKFHALVLMSNHFHLLLSTPEDDLGVVMRHLLGSVTRLCNRNSGREGHVFNGPYKRTLVNSSRYYAHALKYVYRNPVKAGIVTRVEDYEFGTLHSMLGLARLPFPMSHPADGAGDALLPEVPADQLPWLNTPFKREQDDAIGKALRRSVFELPKGKLKRPSILETVLL